MLARQLGNAEPRQPNAAACRVRQIFAGFDVLMDKASLMHMAERACERIAMRRKCDTSRGRPSSRSTGTPPGSASTSVMRSL